MPDIRDRVRSTGQKEQENREKEAKGLLYEAQLLIDELNRRKREDKLKYYVPHAKQMQFHQCPKRNRWAATELGRRRLAQRNAYGMLVEHIRSSRLRGLRMDG